MRIQPCAAVHRKNTKRLGIFDFQTPFQGNKEFKAPPDHMVVRLNVKLIIPFNPPVKSIPGHQNVWHVPNMDTPGHSCMHILSVLGENLYLILLMFLKILIDYFENLK